MTHRPPEPSANNVRNARSHDADPKRNDAVRQRHNPAWVKGHPGASRLFAYREFSSGDVDVLDVCHLFLKQLKPTPGVVTKVKSKLKLSIAGAQNGCNKSSLIRR